MTDENDDIRAALMGAVAEVEEKTPGSTGDLADAMPKSSPVEKQALEPEAKDETKASGSPAKDPATGKFLPKDKVSASPAAPKQDDKSAESAKLGTEAPKADAAPSTWKPESKATWDQIPPAAKADILRREKEFAQFTTEKGGELNQIKPRFEELEQHIGPRRAALTANYGSVGAAVKRLFDISDFATKDAPGFIAWFAQQSGVDLQGLLQGQADAPKVAPEVQQLQQTITGLQNKLQQIEGGFQQQASRSVASELDSVENETDPTGNKLRPHWAALRDKVSPGDGQGPLVAELRIVSAEHPEWSQRQIATEAYDRTVWKLSDYRSQIQGDQQRKSQEEAEAKARAEAASRSRKFVTGQPPGPKAEDESKDNLRDEIAKNYHAAVGGQSRL